MKGHRCKQPKLSGSFPMQIITPLLIIASWFCGWLLTGAHIPAVAQILAPILIGGLFIFLQTPKKVPEESTPKVVQPETETPFANTTSSSLDLDFAEQTLQKSHTYPLRLLSSALNLTTTAIILHNPDQDTYTLHAVHSIEPDTISAELTHGAGILLSLKDDRPEISGHPSSPNFQGLPYHEKGACVGGFMALRLTGIDQHHPLKTPAFLCVDRASTTPWTSAETALIHQTAKKINTDLYVSEQLTKTNHDKKAIQQICLALQDLNTVLGLQEAFETTQQTVTSLTPATLVAITLKDNTGHHVVSIFGEKGDMEGVLIEEQTCLVNQAIRLRRTMTPKGGEKSPVTLFTSPSPIDTYSSLLIIPLISDNIPIGTLIAGGTSPALFSKDQQALLEVVAGQIATRIDLAKTHEQIQHMATIDGLTGLVNHRTFQNGLAKMIARASRQQTTLTLILCDIDHFKKVNDNYGHPFGDEVLRHVSRILKEAVRSVDLAARYGGEEFTLVLENADADGGVKLAERIRKDIEALSFTCEGQEVRVTMSFGISSFPDSASDQATLISQADQALYSCKESGRNRTQCFAQVV